MIPSWIMSTSEPMHKVRMIALKDTTEESLKALQRAGVLHVEESKELRPIDKVAIEQERSEIRKSFNYVENLLAFIPEKEEVFFEEGFEVIYTRPFKELHKEVNTLYAKLNNIYQKITRLSDEVNSYRELKRFLAPLSSQADLSIADLHYSGEYLFSRIFVFSKESYDKFLSQVKSHVLDSSIAMVEDEAAVYIIGKLDEQKVIDSAAENFGGRVLTIPAAQGSLSSYLSDIDNKIPNLEAEISQVNQELIAKTRDNIKDLVLLREALSAENDRIAVIEKACEADYVTLIEGWVPEIDVDSVVTSVKETVESAYIDSRKPDALEVPPTKMKNFKGVQPFQILTKMFATPNYRGWDPTPIVGYFFAIFFGIMFADAVYALGLILATKFLLNKLTDDPESEGFRLFKRLLYTSGAVALVLGVLTGTYLGNIFTEFAGIPPENMALLRGAYDWFSDPIKFIILSLLIGLVHVNIAFILALVKGIKEKNKGEILNKIGIFIFEISGIPYLFHALVKIDIMVLSAQTYTILSYIMFVSIAIIFVSSLMLRGGLGVILFIFDITGLLGDVMSYARLAGVGLATVYLAQVFNLMGGMIYGSMPGIVGGIITGILTIVLLLFGHALNIFLSTLTGFIHSLRLCFVEFLYKFYEGDGMEYSPFRIRKIKSVIAGRKI